MELMQYNKGTGSLKNWLVEESAFDSRYLGKCEAIFALGNGYIGQRAALEERYVGETRGLFVTGTFNKFDDNEVTELPNLPDLTWMDIWVDGTRFSLSECDTTDYSRTLNLKNGELTRKVTLHTRDGKNVRFTFKRFVSLADDHLLGTRVELESDSDISLKVVTGVDGTVSNHGSQHLSEGDKRVYGGKILEYPCKTEQSGVSIILHTALLAEGNAVKTRSMNDRRKLLTELTAQITAGEKFTMDKISSVHSTRDMNYDGITIEEAEKRLQPESLAAFEKVLEKSYDAHFAESEKAWAALWDDQDILIDSENDFDQLGIRFALYHLNIMVKKDDSRVGIGAKAMSGEGYKGHSFWDTETFIFPYFMYAQPDTAKTLLTYRFKSLIGARNKARDNGYEGAMYPWESAWIDDGEVTPYYMGVEPITGNPQYCLTGKIELHVTADIALAVWQYYQATGDQEFMDHCGYEILLDTARFWNSRLEWKEEKGRYELTDVIGPDEYKEHVDNNAYTNYLLHLNMSLAAEIAGKLPQENPELYKNLCCKLGDLAELKASIEAKLPLIYLPQPNENGIIPQFDGYFDLKEIDLRKYKESPIVGLIYQDYNSDMLNDYKVAKQADVVELLYQQEDLFPADIKEKNYYYYEERTLHDSSLSKAIHSVLACDLGLHDVSYQMFQGALVTDLGQKMTSSDAGIHAANMGGIWQDVVMGFGGVRLYRGCLRIAPHLPDNWKELRYAIHWQGSRLNVTVRPGCVTIHNDGDAVDGLLLGGEKHSLAAGETCTMDL